MKHIFIFIALVALVTSIPTLLISQNPCVTSNWGALLSNDCGDIQASGGLAAGSPVIFCEGQTVTVENNSSPSAQITKTYIDWGDGSCQEFNGFQPIMTHAYDFPNDTCILSADGTIVFNLKLGVEKGCSPNLRSFHSVSFSIKVRFKPIAEFFPSPQVACINTEIDFTNTSCENTNIPMYLWNMGNGQTFTTEHVTNFLYPNPGTYSVTLTVTNSCGTSQVIHPVSITPPATANATPSATQICTGDTISFTNNSTNATGYNWTVTPSTGVMFVPPTNSGSATPSIKFNTPGTYTIRMRVIGCGSPEQTFTINVLAPAFVQIIPIPDNCAATGQVVIMPTATLGGTNPSITWQFPNANPNISNSNPPGAITYPGEGTYIISATATNFCGPTTDHDTFTIAPLAIASFTSSATSLCGPDEVLSLNNTSVGGTSTWMITPNAGFQFVNGTSATSYNPQIRFTQEGTYTIKLTVNGCGNPELTQTVTVGLKPTVSMNNIPDQCSPSFELMPNAFATFGGGTPDSVVWSFTNGNISSFTGITAPNVIFSGVGLYIVQIQTTNQCGAQIVADSFRILPQATALATISDDTLCGPSELLSLTNQSTNTFSSSPYLWQITPSSGVSFTGGTSNMSANPQLTFTLEGSYQVVLEVNGCGMPVWDTTVQVFLSPLASVSSIPEGCVDISIDPLTYFQLSGGTPGSVNWTFGGGSPGTAVGTNPGMVNFTGFGLHFIAVQVSNLCGVNSVADSFEILEPAQITLTPVGPFCNTDPSIQLIATPADGTWSGAGVTSGGLFDPSLALLNMPTQLIYQYGTATCVVADTLTIDVRGATVYAGLDSLICSNRAEITFGNFSPPGGSWSGAGVGPTGIFDPLSAGNGLHMLTYTYTDTITGCVNSDQKQITVLGPPTASLDSIGLTCVNEPLDFGPFSGGVDISTCIWSFGDNTTASECDPVHTYSNPGMYTVELTVSNTVGCRDTVQTTIQVATPPNAVFTLDTAMGCADLPVTPSNLSSINDYTLYIWDFGNNFIDTIPFPGAIVYTQGETDTTYLIRLTAFNGCGSAIAEHPVTVFPRPQVRFGTDVASGCTPLEVNFNNVSVGNADNYNWFINNQFVTNSTQLSQQIFYTTDHDSLYYITLIGFNECGSDTVVHSVLVKPNPVKAFFHIDTLVGCRPFAVQLIDYSTQGLYISWDLGDNTTAIGDTIHHTFVNAGQYQIREFVNNGCGFDTAKVEITVLPSPEVGFSHANPVCAGNPVTFQNTSQDIIGSIWDFGDGSADSTLTLATHIYAQPGQYTIQMTGFAVTTGCPATHTSTIEVRNLPAPAVSLPDSFGCRPFTLHPVNQTPGANNFYVWTFGDGATSVEANPSHTYQNAGSYTVQLSVTDLWGCHDDWTYAPVQVFPKPEAVFLATQTELCQTPTTIIFENLSTNSDAFLWDFGPFGASTQIEPQLEIAQATSVNVTLQAVSQFGCRDTTQELIKVYNRPDLDFEVLPQTGCQPFEVVFENHSTNINQYSWHFGDGRQSDLPSPTHVYIDPGVFSVTLYGSADSTCFDSLTMTGLITVLPAPTAAFTFEAVHDTAITPNGLIRFFDQSQHAIRWAWDFGDGNTSEVENPMHRYYVNGPKFVTMIVWNVLGCPDTMVVNLEPDFFGGLYIPNALSPEAGSEGERIFKAVGVGLVEFEINVYASNGMRVWHSDKLENGQPSEGWNGRLNNEGEILPQGVYWWKAAAVFENGQIWKGMSYQNKPPVHEGKVLLIR